jgi:double-strand break repair protein MRE11
MSPNLNISMPVLSIHGNHDDPIGEGESPLCSLNLLAAAGYVNYFGRQIRSDDIQLKPLLFTKNDTHVAIYGLGNMRDKRLYSCFEKDKVQGNFK